MEGQNGNEELRRVRVALLADPGLPFEIADGIRADLPGLLSERLSSEAVWDVNVVCKVLVGGEQTKGGHLTQAIGAHLPDEGWDVGMILTDLPRRSGARPIVAEVSVRNRVGLVSLPALGSIGQRRRAREMLIRLTGMLSGETAQGGRWPGRRVGRFEETDGCCARLVTPGLRGRLRLFAGMVRANRPWKLALGLSKMLAVVAATAALGLANSSVWRMADTLSPLRQAGIMALSIAALVAWLVIDHELWERPSSQIERDRAVLYNRVTLATLTLGVLCLYAGVLLMLAVITPAVITGEALRTTIGHAGPGTYLALVWFATSLAMVGGAIATGLEADVAVRHAAYGARHRRRLSDAATRDRAGR
ncbi:MAG: hypothetical protein JWO67_6135 [Streptosporangiaceae bacterium]|nr:hypothetical protein [Streptosporangiaceae bacterium]